MEGVREFMWAYGGRVIAAARMLVNLLAAPFEKRSTSARRPG